MFVNFLSNEKNFKNQIKSKLGEKQKKSKTVFNTKDLVLFRLFILYSCNKITKTWVQISCWNSNDFFQILAKRGRFN